VGSGEFLWALVRSDGFWWFWRVLVGAKVLHFLVRFSRFCLVLVDIGGFGFFLLESWWVLVGAREFWWVLLGSARFW
jgi:hypothetical protein